VVLYNHIKEKKFKKGGRVFLLTQASGLVIGGLFVTLGELEVK